MFDYRDGAVVRALDSHQVVPGSIPGPGVICELSLLKPGFHMSGKSQTIGDFTFFRPSQILLIYRICARGLSHIFPIMNYLFVIGGLEPSNLGDW